MGLVFLLFWAMVKPWFSTMCLTSLQSKFSQAIPQLMVSGTFFGLWTYKRRMNCICYNDCWWYWAIEMLWSRIYWFLWWILVLLCFIIIIFFKVKQFSYNFSIPCRHGKLLKLCDKQIRLLNYVIFLVGLYEKVIFGMNLTGFLRDETESGDGETRDSFSDSCSDESESDKLWRWDGCSSEEGGSEQDNLWHLNDRLGYLYFQYFERSTPYGRVPLMDKVSFYYFNLGANLNCSFLICDVIYFR